MDYKNFTPFTVLFALAVGANVFLWYMLSTIPRHTIVTALDVGQGDAILIRTPLLQHILIDGGPDQSILAALGNQLPFYVKKIDLVIVSHAHADHIAGLLNVIKKYDVNKIMITDAQADTRLFAEFEKEIETRQIEIIRPHLGMIVAYSVKESSPRLVVLHPFGPYHAHAMQSSHQSRKSQQQPPNLNNTSIVLFLDDAQDVLFTGDAEHEVESLLLGKNLVFPSDILKVGHHGSNTSTSELFLRAVSPKTAVISVGKRNRYKHPSAQTLERLVTHGVTIFRTDEMSDSTFVLRK